MRFTNKQQKQEKNRNVISIISIVVDTSKTTLLIDMRDKCQRKGNYYLSFRLLYRRQNRKSNKRKAKIIVYHAVNWIQKWIQCHRMYTLHALDAVLSEPRNKVGLNFT